MEAFNELNEIYSILEDEGWGDLYDELSNKVKCTYIAETLKILVKIKKVFDELSYLPVIGADATENFTTEDLSIVLEWMDKQKELMYDIEAIDCLPDTINYGDTIYIKNNEFKTLKFSLDGLFLSPEEGSVEDINISLYAPNGEILATGCVSVTYGFITYDDDGSVDDGCSDDISYNYDDITDVLKDEINNWKKLVDEQVELANLLRKEFELD